MKLTDFNTLPAAEAAETVAVWADILFWVERIVADRPYASVNALAENAGLASADWDVDDLDAALAGHPRIGERPAGDGAGAAASRSEQAAMTDAVEPVTRRVAEGNARYEARFGRVFLIRAAGRTPDEIAAELDRRLENDPDTEADEALVQLAEIAMLRLRTSVEEDA